MLTSGDGAQEEAVTAFKSLQADVTVLQVVVLFRHLGLHSVGHAVFFQRRDLLDVSERYLTEKIETGSPSSIDQDFSDIGTEAVLTRRF